MFVAFQPLLNTLYNVLVKYLLRMSGILNEVSIMWSERKRKIAVVRS